MKGKRSEEWVAFSHRRRFGMEREFKKLARIDGLWFSYFLMSSLIFKKYTSWKIVIDRTVLMLDIENAVRFVQTILLVSVLIFLIRYKDFVKPYSEWPMTRPRSPSFWNSSSSLWRLSRSPKKTKLQKEKWCALYSAIWNRCCWFDSLFAKRWNGKCSKVWKTFRKLHCTIQNRR